MSSSPLEVDFVTRSGCHLCEDALPLVLAEAGRRGIEVRVVDVDTDDELVRDFGLRVPVLRDAAGRVLAEGPMDGRTVREALASL